MTAATHPVTGASASVTAAIAERGRAVTFAGIPAAVVAKAQHCVLDWLGVALGGAAAEATAIARAQALADGGNPASTLLGSGERVTAPQAALINGIASHVLDFDDVSAAMGGHPSVAVLPAALALAESRHATGADLIAALVVGIETCGRIGRLVQPEHYIRGFHNTGTIGTFGAAAACAHLLGLPAEQWLAAVGIAGASAAGVKSMFGTMSKPLQAGRAAENGLRAARLAGGGFTAADAVLDDRQGFALAYGGAGHPESALADPPSGSDVSDVLFKAHAACLFTHSSIDGLLALRTRGLRAENIARIELRVAPGHLAAAGIEAPRTPLEAKFSLRFTSALAAIRGSASELDFTAEAIADPGLVELRDRVTVVADPDRALVTGVRVETTDGRELHADVDVSIPTPTAALDGEWDKLEAKFLSLAAPVVGEQAAAGLVAAVAGLPQAATVGALFAAGAPAVGVVGTVGAGR